MLKKAISRILPKNYLSKKIRNEVLSCSRPTGIYSLDEWIQLNYKFFDKKAKQKKLLNEINENLKEKQNQQIMITYTYEKQRKKKSKALNLNDLVKPTHNIRIYTLSGLGIQAKFNKDLHVFRAARVLTQKDQEKFVAAINNPLNLYISAYNEYLEIQLPLNKPKSEIMESNDKFYSQFLTRIAHNLKKEKGKYFIEKPLEKINEENLLTHIKKMYEGIERIEIIIGTEEVNKELFNITGAIDYMKAKTIKELTEKTLEVYEQTGSELLEST